jgi:DNA-binding CsgD family transcriptional regulator/tetratricopeptide (TPR) repeat protein
VTQLRHLHYAFGVAGRANRRWEVVGTDPLVAGIRATLGDPEIGVVVLTGPAGIGKTALSRRVAEDAERSGRPTLRIVASLATAERPYGALSNLLEVTDQATAGSPGGPRIDIRGVDVGDRLLLLVDDLPLLDPASAAEVANLVRRGDADVLATARTGHHLPPAVDGLAVEGRMAVRELEPLDADALGAAAEAALGAPLSATALERLMELSGGVPLHARELVTANTASGRLVARDGCWDLAGDLAAPPSLFDLVASRFVQLDEATRRSLEALCIVQPLTIDAARSLVGLDVLVHLERNDLVAVAEEAGAQVVRLAHPLYEESILGAMSALRRRAAVERAAERLSAAAADDPDLTHRLVCLRTDQHLPVSPDEALTAAQRSLNLLDPAAAERLLAPLANEDRSADVLLVLGAALAAQGRTEEADRVLAEAWDAALDDEQRARALSRRAGNLGPGTGRFEEAVVLLTEGLAAVADPRWRAFLEADITYFRSWAGEQTEVVGDHQSAVSPQVRANECLVGAIIAAMAGDLAIVDPLVDEGLGLVSTIERDVPHARDVLVLARFLGRAFGGDSQGARAIADGELARARTSSSGAAGVWLSVRSLQHLVDGDLDRALAEASESVDSLVLGDVAGLRPMALAVRSVALARRGDVEGSRAVAAQVDPAWRDEVKVQILLTQAAAWQEAAAGHVDAAAELLAGAGRVGQEANHLPLGALAAYDAVRLDRPGAVVDLLDAIAGRWDGPMARAVVAHARAIERPRPVDHDLDRLAEVGASLPSLGLSLAGVSAWLQLDRAATAQRRDDVARKARLAAARSPLADVAAPAATRPRPLTAREVEVARSVAAGRTSREVAEELRCSVRTVDNHLAAIYRKLGVSRRTDLAPLLDDLAHL